MPDKSLEEFYRILTLAHPAAEPPVLMQREVGDFTVVNVADMMPGYAGRPPMKFDRRSFYKISLIQGRSRVEYADQSVEVNGKALWFASHRVPYRWMPHDLNQTGYFCAFTDAFLLPAKGGAPLDELTVFRPGTCPLWTLTDAEYAAIEPVFQKMEREAASSFAYKYDLVRAYLWELILLGQKQQPAAAPPAAPSAAARLTARFTDLLERQFPLATSHQQLRLRTAKDFADALAVHVNHLNRVLRETTGHTTTALISARIGQEARLLLKHTGWTVSEIADCLGFADVAHFCHFFKRQTGLTPGAFRD